MAKAPPFKAAPAYGKAKAMPKGPAKKAAPAKAPPFKAKGGKK